MVRSSNSARYASAAAAGRHLRRPGLIEHLNTSLGSLNAGFLRLLRLGLGAASAAVRGIRQFFSRQYGLALRFFRGCGAIVAHAHSVAVSNHNPLLFIPDCARGFAAAARRHRRFAGDLALTAAPVAAALVLGATVLFWSNATFALEVKSDGQLLGYVTSESVFENAKSDLTSRLLSCDETTGLTFTPSYSLALVSKSDLMSAGTLANEMISNSAYDLAEAAGLYVDGRLIAACPTKEEIQEALGSYLACAGRESDGKATFYSDIHIEQGLYLTDSIISAGTLYEKISCAQESPISIQVRKTVTRMEEIAFSTVEVKDSSKDTSYRRVTKSGKPGKAEITEKVIYINGTESQRMVENKKVLVEPVEKKIVIGTAEIPKTLVAAGDGIATGTFAWPVQKVPRMYVSAYWGDGRGHKGVDIAAPKGTLIYAADGGTVVSVKTDSRYGKYFVVDHGNNIRTLYAHCSEINVTAGQKVSRGQAIAKVGSTGNSTGPHLHIEVHLGGVQVNPAPYLGIR